MEQELLLQQLERRQSAFLSDFEELEDRTNHSCRLLLLVQSLPLHLRHCAQPLASNLLSLLSPFRSLARNHDFALLCRSSEVSQSCCQGLGWTRSSEQAILRILARQRVQWSTQVGSRSPCRWRQSRSRHLGRAYERWSTSLRGQSSQVRWQCQ